MRAPWSPGPLSENLRPSSSGVRHKRRALNTLDHFSGRWVVGRGRQWFDIIGVRTLASSSLYVRADDGHVVAKACLVHEHEHAVGGLAEFDVRQFAAGYAPDASCEQTDFGGALETNISCWRNLNFKSTR